MPTPTPLLFRDLSKRFDAHVALRDVSVEIPSGRVAGLLGRNGSGKTTLFNIACGLMLPTSGTCMTLGRAAADLDSAELAQLGVVFQENRFLDWMTVRQHLEYTGSFYPRWDWEREKRLLSELELDERRKIVQLSTGDQQKLGVILGVCHHPALLLLDEPMSVLDPIVRTQLLTFLVDFVREDGCTIVISSHLLGDVEKIVDWIVCLDAGALTVSAPFDEIQESYEEWIVTPTSGSLPVRFTETWVLTQEVGGRQARLRVRAPGEALEHAFASTHGATIAKRPLNLDQLFPLLVRERRQMA